MIYYEGGQQQQQRAIHVGFIFIFFSPDILLTPRIHDFFRAQGGGSGGGGADTIDLRQGGVAAAAAGYLS
jgi:hypothetical protein